MSNRITYRANVKPISKPIIPKIGIAHNPIATSTGNMEIYYLLIFVAFFSLFILV